MGQGAPDVQSTEICFWFFLIELRPSFERKRYSERSWSNFANDSREGPDQLSVPVHIMNLC